jgi:DNA polymerase-4
MRRHGVEAATIAIKVRLSDFTTLSRSRTLPEPTAVGQRIGEAAIEMFDTIERSLPVRLVGVRGERLRAATGALGLWDDDEEWRAAEDALDGAAERFGRGAVTRAALLGPRRDDGVLPSHPLPSHDG